MFLQFVPKTHLFFTAGKDKKIKQWDADKFEHIQTLEVKMNIRRSRSVAGKVFSPCSTTGTLALTSGSSPPPRRVTTGRSGV